MQQRFEKFIDDKQLLKSGEKVLLAVSGGMDSMAMLHLFYKAGYQFHIAHCNFQLRGKQSDLDEAIVADMAKKLKLEFHCKKFDTLTEAKKNKTSIQLTARNLRYKWFDEICEQQGLDKIATAHHLDDSIETFFVNLNRGTGIAGLKGIPVSNSKLIRPMSNFSRTEIESFVKKNKIPYREDSSNKESKYLRNWFRNELLPLWKQRNPQFEGIMKSNLELLNKQEKLYRKLLQGSLGKLRQELDSGSLNIATLNELPEPEIILFEFFNSYGFTYSDIQQLVPLLKKPSSGKAIESADYTLLLDRKKVFLKKKMSKEKPDVYLVENEGDTAHLPVDLRIEIKKSEETKINPSPLEFQADLDSIEFPLLLRKWEAGDVFVPLGMKGRKKVSDYLIDQKIPLTEKDNVYVLLSNNKLIWLLGYRADESSKVREKTKRVLQIIWNKP